MTTLRTRLMAAIKSFWNPTLAGSAYAANRLSRYEMAWGFYSSKVRRQVVVNGVGIEAPSHVIPL